MKTHIKQILIWSIALITTLMALLFFHIYAVTQSSEQQGTDWQLTRVEFTEYPLSPLTSMEARQVIDTIPGVKDSYLNVEKGTLVFATEKGSFKSEEVFNQFIMAGQFDATKYAPEKGIQSGTGCPVLDKKSLTYRIGSFFQDFIKKK